MLFAKYDKPFFHLNRHQYIFEEWAKDNNVDLKKTTYTIQGFGKVGYWAAHFMNQRESTKSAALRNHLKKRNTRLRTMTNKNKSSHTRLWRWRQLLRHFASKVVGGDVSLKRLCVAHSPDRRFGVVVREPVLLEALVDLVTEPAHRVAQLCRRLAAHRCTHLFLKHILFLFICTN